MKNERLVIVDGVRTPFCKIGTDLASLGADELGRIAVNALLTRTGIDPNRIDEVIFGCVGQPVDAANVARVIALRAGIPEHVPALTVHRNCASGCEALTQAHDCLSLPRLRSLPFCPRRKHSAGNSARWRRSVHRIFSRESACNSV